MGTGLGSAWGLSFRPWASYQGSLSRAVCVVRFIPVQTSAVPAASPGPSGWKFPIGNRPLQPVRLIATVRIGTIQQLVVDLRVKKASAPKEEFSGFLDLPATFMGRSRGFSACQGLAEDLFGLPVVVPPHLIFGCDALVERRDCQHVYDASDDKPDSERFQRALRP